MDRMKYISQAYVGRCFLVILLLLGTVSCDDYYPDAQVPVASAEGVPVELSFGFADEEDGYTLAGRSNTRSGKETQDGAFCTELTPVMHTRGGEVAPDLQPDALYKLYMLQYNKDTGALLSSGSIMWRKQR